VRGVEKYCNKNGRVLQDKRKESVCRYERRCNERSDERRCQKYTRRNKGCTRYMRATESCCNLQEGDRSTRDMTEELREKVLEVHDKQ
jgi:hypothetical protein